MNRRGFLQLLGIGAAGTALGWNPFTAAAAPAPAEFLVGASGALTPIEDLEMARRAFGVTAPLRSNFTDLAWMTQEMARATAHALSSRLGPLRVDPRSSRLGEAVHMWSVSDGSKDDVVTGRIATLDQQFKVSTAITGREAFTRDHQRGLALAIVGPAARQMAGVLAERRVSVFGALPLIGGDSGLESAVSVCDDIAVRGLRVWNPARMVHEIRFDVLGGRA